MKLVDNKYQVGGADLLSICERFGTPLFIYDANKIIEQFQTLQNAIKVEDLDLHFACKALTNINILKLLRLEGAKLDAVSIQEIRLGLLAGFRPEDILYTPNCVSAEELEQAVELEVQLNIDNLEMLEYMGVHHKDYPISVRINPHVMAGGNSKISVGHIDSKFGISIHQLPLIKRLVETLDLKINGVHMHTGSDILDVDVFLYAADILFNIAKHFENLEFINFGSGFKVKYKPHDISTDIEHFGARIATKFHAFCKEYGKPLRLKFEPGKFLVSEAGYFCVRTNVIKQTTSTVFAGVDSGFNHLIRPMFYDAYHHITNLSNPEGRNKIYTVVGYICETDTFGVNRVINELRPGDIMVFQNAGAYCQVMSSNYNSRLRPAEVLVHKGTAELIRKRDTFDDLVKNQVILDLD